MFKMKDIFGDKSSITRIDSPRIVKEKKSRDFDTTSVRSPRTTRRERGVQKNFVDINTQCWSIKYEVENQDFAKGAYGKIMLAKDKINGDRVVIKKIPQTTPIRMINNEVKAGKIIGSHPNIPALLQYVDKPDFHFLVFQFVNGRDLFCYLEHLEFSPRPESEARSIITDVLKGLHHLHTHAIAHRDIKLENILLDEKGRAFVIDMGLCAFMEEGKLNREWCGSDNYLAPEIVRRTPYNAYKADVFSCGVVLFALVYGVFPFDNLRVNGGGFNFANPLKKLQVRFPTDVKASEGVKDLLWRMLEDDPEQRIDLKDVLSHPWITNSQQATSFVEEKAFHIKDISCEAVTFLM